MSLLRSCWQIAQFWGLLAKDASDFKSKHPGSTNHRYTGLGRHVKSFSSFLCEGWIQQYERRGWHNQGAWSLNTQLSRQRGSAGRGQLVHGIPLERGGYISHIKLGGSDALIHALDDFLGDPV